MQVALVVVFVLVVVVGSLTIATGRDLVAAVAHKPAAGRTRLLGLSHLVLAASIAPIVFRFRLGSPLVTLICQISGAVLFILLQGRAYNTSGDRTS